ncbi:MULTISPECIES: signal peptidase I [unclassified Chryseobacterium]|uniref:signal peptidase I n=1 Tax=unclassified Chryseobacterium TaxID=2593645 RepID=UPI000FEECCBC|nr:MULTISPECIES: signal peptidase I [unclassified Chryseobacterium]RKE77081.1 signal peptidase I [Chryseobacterium sp. AG363]WNI36416.1 signal peptidase I [Chryseobacterium sp. SG20098]
MFKSKIFNRVLLTGSFIVTLFIIAKLSGVLQYAFVPEAGNEPTIKRKSFIFMTNILPYERFKMIAYNQNNLDYPAGVYVQRLIGVGNDKILIKNGKLYVNDTLIDQFNVKHSYKIDRGYANDLIYKGVEDNEIIQIDDDYFITQLSEKELNNNFFHERFINPNTDEDIYKVYSKDWSADNFGPIVVPKGKLFFLGDSRNGSLDSRYLGFVDENETIGRVFYPKN